MATFAGVKAGTALAAIALIAALTPASAAADQRWAAPGGSGTACTHASPCDFEEAVEQAADGDEVVVEPGAYTANDVLLDSGAVVHGVDGQPRPVIFSAGAPAIRVEGNPNASLRWLAISHSGGGDALLLDDGGARMLYVASSGNGFACNVRGATLQDSICWANSGGFAAGSDVTGEYQRTNLFNVTAFASGPGSRGLRVAATNGFADLYALNLIARGEVDTEVDSTGGSSVAVANMDFSNFATQNRLGPESHASPPGIAHNQTASPVFAGPANGDFHQDPSSPTVDRGTLDYGEGDVDIDGEPRIDGFGVDIGADELVVGAPPPDANPPDTRILKKPRARTSQRVARFKFGTTEPVNAVFMCRVDKREFRPCKSPLKLRVKRRRHTFSVYSIDESGNADPSPDAYSWKVRKPERDG
jgi:hypothetical protein